MVLTHTVVIKIFLEKSSQFHGEKEFGFWSYWYTYDIVFPSGVILGQRNCFISSNSKVVIIPYNVPMIIRNL